MSKNITTCGECGAKTVEYHHRLNVPLVLCLRRLYNEGTGPTHLRDLNLNNSQINNFQKLRYFGLVEKSYDGDGERMAGFWQITQKGINFITGVGVCTSGVWTYRGEYKSSDPNFIHFYEVVGDYQKRPEWAAEAVPHKSNV